MQNTLVIVGSGGTILRSDDAGETWKQIDSGTMQHLHDVAFHDVLHGIAVGMWGTVLVTQDGGRTWTRENAGTQDHLKAVAFGRDGVALAVGTNNAVLRRFGECALIFSPSRLQSALRCSMCCAASRCSAS